MYLTLLVLPAAAVGSNTNLCLLFLTARLRSKYISFVLLACNYTPRGLSSAVLSTTLRALRDELTVDC
jgi:hypothetical protein